MCIPLHISCVESRQNRAQFEWIATVTDSLKHAIGGLLSAECSSVVIFVALAVPLLSLFHSHPLTAAANGSQETAKLRPIRACGVLNAPNFTYVLQNDVRASGTCFSIQANDITLDLKKHTVTYGVSDNNRPVFGILAADCWDTSVGGNPCGGTHRHLVVMNGNIVQGSAAAPFSHAMKIGQAKDITGVTIHDLNITIAAQDSFGIYTEYLPGGSDIYDNTIHNNVKVISNRYQFRGASIKLEGESDAKLPDLIHNNVIIGGAQLGIRDDNSAGTRIYANDISQDATYANGFCIDAAGNAMQVYRNHCHPIHGRGIHANHNGVRIFDNVIETVDSNQIQEYKGCELHGTYGIQVESDEFNPRDVLVYGNQVTVHAAQCPAVAMRLNELKGSDIEVFGNTFIAVQDRVGNAYSTATADGFCAGDLQGSHLRFYSNIIRADSAIFSVDWDSGGQITLNDDTFQAGRMGNATLVADFETGVAPSQDNYFLDDKYEGLLPGSVKFGPYAGDSWYEVLNSIQLDVIGKNGSPPLNLSGVAIEPSQKTSSSGITNESGKLTFTLATLRVENNKPQLRYPNYQVTLSAQACHSDAFVVSAERKQMLTRQLSCQ